MYSSLKKDIFLYMTFMFICELSAGPTISLDGSPEKTDLGKYPSKESREAVFKLKNTGDASLKISNLRKTCGACAKLSISKTELPPGESAEMKVEIIKDTIYGPYCKNFFIESNDSVQKFLKVTVAGDAVPVITVKPGDRISTGRLSPGKTWTQEFILSPTENGVIIGEPLIQSSSPAEVSVEKQDTGNYLLKLKISVQDAFGDMNCKIEIPVTKPEGWKPIELMVNGMIGNAVSIIPSKMLFSQDDTGEVTKTFQAKLISTAEEKMDPQLFRYEKISGIELEFGEVKDNTSEVTAIFEKSFLASLKAQKKTVLRFEYPGTEPVEISMEFE